MFQRDFSVTPFSFDLTFQAHANYNFAVARVLLRSTAGTAADAGRASESLTALYAVKLSLGPTCRPFSSG